MGHRSHGPPTRIRCSIGASAWMASVVFTDDELDELAEDYVAAAVLAQQAGFDFVDVKHCHGYLLHELLSGYDREGRYGGDLAGRTEFLRVVVAGDPRAGTRAGDRRSSVGVRSGAVHGGRRRCGRSRVDRAVPVRVRRRRHGAGHRPHRDPCAARPVRRVSASVWSAPRRAARTTTPTSSARPTSRRRTDTSRRRTRCVGVARQLAVTRELTIAHPDLTIIGSGYSYLQDWLAHVGQAVVDAGRCVDGRPRSDDPVVSRAGRRHARRLVRSTLG